MKRIISVLILAAILTSLFGVFAFADSDKVEIAFCVGDDTLSINGAGVKVEKPYVVGEGVTLVPLRVITEAFGATVGWEGETKTITLSYPGVEIILQIANPIAEVNKKAQTLLAAPELTPNGVTMVPLRFISETFGAVVGYDEATARITVTKGKVETGSIVQGGLETKKVGDSFYKWTMDNPAEMTLSERAFDGSYTEFTYDSDDGFCVIIMKKDEEYSFEREYKAIKESLNGMSLIQADKDTYDENRETMHFKAKNTDKYIEIIFIEGYSYCYEILVSTKATSTERIKYIGDIIATFTNAFDGADTHDLSNVVNNMREYKSENMKLSFMVPADYYQGGDLAVENELFFLSSDDRDKDSYVVMDIYSASQVGSAEEFAKKDFGRNSERLNKKIVTINEFVNKSGYKNFDAFEYTYEVKSDFTHRMVRDVFFQIGDYVYNAAISIKNPGNNANAIMDEIINSVKAEELDPEKIGILIRNDGEYEGTFTYKGDDGYSLTIPNSYDKQEIGDYVIFTRDGGVSAATLYVTASPLETRFDEELRKFTKALKSSMMTKTTKTTKSVEDVTVHSVGKYRCGDFKYRTIEDNTSVVTRVLVFQQGSKLYVFELAVNEIYDSEFMNKELEEIVTSITFE